MILERYIHKEILSKLVWIIGLLVLILASNRFVEYLADAAAGQLPSDLILKMLSMKMLAMLPKLLPVALFIGVILGLSRLSKDKELTIVSSSGIADRFQFISVFRFALLFSILIVMVSFYVSPWAERKVGELKDKANVESDITGITAGQFKEFSKGDRIVYVEKLGNSKQTMENVFLQVRQEDGRLGVLNSDSARYKIQPPSGSRYILFENGRRYVGQPGMLDYQITDYRTYAVLLQQGQQVVNSMKLEAIPFMQLWKSDLPMYKAELQWRISYVITCLLLPLLAVVLNRFSFGEKGYTSVFVAILIYFVYSNLLGISKTLLKRDDIPVWIGLWWVHILLIGIGILLLKLPNIKRYFRIRSKKRRAKTL